MIIYEAIRKDHEVVKRLLSELVNAAEAKEDVRARILSDIRDELIPHARAEEAIFYNSLREIKAAKPLVLHGYEDHLEAEALLRSLQITGAVNINWVNGAKKLKEAIESHIREEETKVFDAAKQLFLDQEAEVMGEAFEKMKPEIKEGSVMKSTLEMVANMMPSRLRDAVQMNRAGR